MNKLLAKLLQFAMGINPAILVLIAPWLRRQSDNLWREALPWARKIIIDLQAKDLPGLAKHTAAVTQLVAKIIAEMKLQPGDIDVSNVALIIITAYKQLFQSEVSEFAEEKKQLGLAQLHLQARRKRK